MSWAPARDADADAGFVTRRVVCHPSGRHDSAAPIGNADYAPARDLTTPRRTAMQLGVVLRLTRLGGSSRGGLGVPGRSQARGAQAGAVGRGAGE